MAEREICQEIEFCILSDTKLTNEQEKHLNSCESCKKLFSQTIQMKYDVASLESVLPGNASITKSVMKSIKKSKKYSSFPKPKFMHHMGTAAAIVIIFAAALVIKNQTPQENFDASQDNTQQIVFGIPEENNHVLKNTAGGAGASQNPVTDMVESEAEPLLVADEAEDYEYYDDTADISYARAEICEAIPKLEDELMTTDSTAKQDDTQETVNAPAVMMFKSAGVKKENMQTRSSSEFVFEGIAFENGNENFDINIALINERLYELYGKGYVLSKEKLQKLGISNEKLIKIASALTFEMLEDYKDSFDIFE